MDMDITRALEIITELSQDQRLNILETLQYMQENFDDLYYSEQRAYRIAMRDFAKLVA